MSDADQATAASLSQAGALVAGVDSRYYLDRLNQVSGQCRVLIGDAEALSRHIQRQYVAQGYQSPILVGVGSGGALAETTLEQARPNTIAGAVTLDIRLNPMMGAPACTNTETLSVDQQIAVQGPRVLQGFWHAAFRPGAPDPDHQTIIRWPRPAPRWMCATCPVQ